MLTLGESGRVTAEVLAKIVIVMGEVKGTITATETIDIRKTASVDGELIAPRVGIAEGAFFRGRIDMQRSETNKAKPASTDKKTPVAQPPSSQPRRTETGVPMVASSA